MRRTIYYTYCRACSKRTYHSKSDARRARKQVGGGMGIYRCPEALPTDIAYHIGHKASTVTREQMRARDDWRRGTPTTPTAHSQEETHHD